VHRGVGTGRYRLGAGRAAIDADHEVHNKSRTQ
jgi:hypothetical protein